MEITKRMLRNLHQTLAACRENKNIASDVLNYYICT